MEPFNPWSLDGRSVLLAPWSDAGHFVIHKDFARDVHFHFASGIVPMAKLRRALQKTSLIHL